MAPTEITRQTEQIIECLFDDNYGVSCRQLNACVEPDGPGDNEESFDPTVIADKLRSVADSLNDDVTFRAALDELKGAAAREAVEAAFSRGVELLCQSHVAQMAEVAPEMQLIRASVAFGLYVKQSYPELKSKVQEAMASFLNRRVENWVAQKGGWSKAV